MLRLRKHSKFRIGRNTIYAIIAITIISMIAAGSGTAAFSFKDSVKDLLGISPGVSSVSVRPLEVSAPAPWTYTISPTTVSLGELTNFTVTVQSLGGNCGTNQMMASFEMTLPSNFTLGTPTVVSAGDGSTFHHWLISASGQTVRTWALADGDKICQDDILILNVPAMAISGPGTSAPWTGMAYRNQNFTDPFPSDPVAGQPIVTVGACVPPIVTTSPVDQTVTYGAATVQFTSAASGSVTSSKWQVSTDGGLTFIDLVNNATYNGVATGTLTITNPIYAMSGYRYHTVFTGFCEPTTLTTTDATLVVNKAAATIAIAPYNLTYDGNAHTATGTATGAFGENLDALLNFSGTVHINAGSYPGDTWVFAGDANHLATAGTITDNISKATAICTVTGYNVMYDGAPHTATGACLGVLQETLAGLDLSGTTHTAANNYPSDPWIFTDVTGNYNNANGTVADNISQSTGVTCTVTGFSGVYDGAPHGATGSCLDVAGAPVTGLVIDPTTYTNVAGGLVHWVFTNANYVTQSGDATVTITKATPVCTVTGYNVMYDGAPHTATGACLGVLQETLVGLDLSGTTHTAANNYPSDPWIFTDVTGNYNNANGTVADNISRSTAAVCTVTGYDVPFDALPHTATGQCLGIGGEVLAGLDLTGTTHTDPGTYPADPWSFTDVTGNYNGQTGTVVDIIRNQLTDLSITKTDGLTTVRSGDPVTYTIVVTNPGPAAVVGASATDTFPGEFTGATWTCFGVGGGVCPPNGVGNINVNVDLPVGATVTFTATGTVVLGAQNSTLSNTSTVMPPPNMVDPNLANNTATDVTTVILRADLAITKTDNKTNLTPGDQTTYTIVVTNNGPVPAVNAIVTDNFPAGVIVDNWTCLRQNWAMCTLAGAGNINDVVYIPVGGILTYTARVTTNWNLTGLLVNTATVTPPSTIYDPILSNNTATDTDNFVISISGNIKHFVQGGPHPDLAGVTLTLAGSNSGTGTTDASGNYTFSDVTSGGSWTITPSMNNEVFEPTGRTVSAATANVTGIDFIAHDWSSAYRNVFMVNTHAMPGNLANVPVRMVSQGTERTMMFSVDYPTNELHEPTVGCGESTPGCNVVLDTSMPGKLGVTITAPTTLEAGLREIAVMTFHTNSDITVPNAPLTFGDAPVACRLRDEINNDLPVTWTSGFVVFVRGIEGDVTNRSSGDGSVLATDVVQMRRFVVGLDPIQPMYNEFQRADTAPFATFGDGQLLSADIVQARRYASRLDELTPAAGPAGPPLSPLGTAMRPGTVKGTEFPQATRTVRAGTANAVPGEKVALAVELEPFGDEVAAGFTLEFNAARLTNAEVALAGDASATAVLTVNMNNAEDGRIGVLIDSAEPLARGSEVRQLVIITFDVAPNAPGGDTPIKFTDGLAKRGLSDELGNTLDVLYTDGAVMISGPIAYGIEVSGRVTTSNGQGLRNAQVTITDSAGEVRTVITGTFGYYRFEGIAPAAGYTVSVLSRRFRFTPRHLATDDDLTGVNLIAQE